MISGPMICATGAGACASGGTLANRKNAWDASHIASAGAAVLKAMRSRLWPRLDDTMLVLIATAIVAGAGPKKIAEAMKNVSVTEMLADSDAIFIVKRPVSSASAVNSSQTNVCGMCSSAGSDQTIAAAPIAMTERT